MKIAALQMISTPRVAENLAAAQALIAQAASQGAELLALPEYFCGMWHRDEDKLDFAEPLDDGPIQDMLRTEAQRWGVWIVGGTLPLRLPEDPRHASNSILVFNPSGQRVARYDKIHLFKFEDNNRRYDESLTLRAGHQPVSFQLTDRCGHHWRIGLSVCYDLRFPELYRQLMQQDGQPCDLLLVPAAFTYTTGQAHWETLLRARAIENQCYVMAPAQGGVHENGRRTWGHSLCIDPWGELVGLLPEGPAALCAEITLARLAEIRALLPALDHRVLTPQA